MGHASERHDLMSQETHAARWIGFRQPVLRVALEKQGKRFDCTWQAHEAAGLGQVWEEDEFWIELSWRIDPDGSLGIRKYFESPYRPGREAAHRGVLPLDLRAQRARPARGRRGEGLTPLAYMRKYGAFLVQENVYGTHETPVSPAEREGAAADPAIAPGDEERGRGRRGGRRAVDGRLPDALAQARVLLADPQGLELAGARGADLHASHVHWTEIDRAAGEMACCPPSGCRP